MIRTRSAILPILLVTLVACATPAPPPPTAEPQPITAATPTAEPTPTSASLAPEDAMMATILAGTTPTATPDAAIPTPIPTITLGPTAVAQPLAAGWWDGAVCYEVFVRSFADSDGDGIGDLQGLITRLDYINDGDPQSTSDLGATCIWLMPVAEAASYHGYDTIDYYTVEQDYGSNADFKQLTEAAHQRGVKVIIDLVLNHTSSQHPWFLEAAQNPASPYRDWFLWSPIDPGYAGPWGQKVWHRTPGQNDFFYGIFWEGMPDLNYRNPAVTAEAHKISAFWLNEMGVDGFRLDAIKHIVEAGREQENTRETWAWLREYAAFLRSIKPDVFTVGEIFGGRPGVLDGYYPDQLDTYFEFGVGEGILRAARSGDARDFLRPVVAAQNGLPFQRYAPFLTNHDQERAITTMGGDLGRARVAALALLTLPGMPFLYYGEEIGMGGTKPDERLRTPMQWEHSPGAGFTTATPWEGLQNDIASANVAVQDADPQSLLNLYRQLIRIHTNNPALAQGELTPITTTGAPGVAAFLRHSGDQTVLVLINFATTAATPRFDLAASHLAVGTYQLTPLYGDAAATTLTVAENGAIADAAPLTELGPQTGAIFVIENTP